MKTCIATILLLAATAVTAQDEMPAVNTESPAVNTEGPAVNTESPAVGTPVPAPSETGPAVKRPTVRTRTSSGTTVVGEQETPLGLFIMPWKASKAESGLDRPARFLREALVPVDSDVFRRQIEFYRALSEHLEKSGRPTP